MAACPGGGAADGDLNFTFPAEYDAIPGEIEAIHEKYSVPDLIG